MVSVVAVHVHGKRKAASISVPKEEPRMKQPKVGSDDKVHLLI